MAGGGLIFLWQGGAGVRASSRGSANLTGRELGLAGPGRVDGDGNQAGRVAGRAGEAIIHGGGNRRGRVTGKASPARRDRR